MRNSLFSNTSTRSRSGKRWKDTGKPETWSGWKWVRIKSVIESRAMPARPSRTLGVLTQSISTTPSEPIRAMWVFSCDSSGMALDVPSTIKRAIGLSPEQGPQRDLRSDEDFHHRRQRQQRNHQPDRQ